MEISKTTMGILAAACITAGAGGAYLATRSARPSPEAQAPPATTDASSTAGVKRSGGVTTDAPATPAAEAAPAVPPRSPRSGAPARARTRTERARPAQFEGPRETPNNSAAPTQASEETRTPAPVVPPPLQPIEPEPVRAVEPPEPRFEDLVVSADSVLGLQMETSLSSERARVEDAVVARVTRDVRVGDRVAIPSGSKAHGEVTLVERGGKLREKARLGIRFTSVVLADGTRVPLETDTIYREGDGPGGESAAKIGGSAIGGAILGGIFGGAKGAVIGGTTGAGAGTAAVMAGGRNPATLPSGTPVTVRLVKPATVTVVEN